ncbi:hypothetical protein NDU88_002861 [Pleurodeles waltl]|uniref:Uncharacterized protein n=1 Tax=Pleurodeles waltl TaxID=8319 RepID=A0AAV7W0J0_PLEWA|nr:hypothetical protein NDU88_002861 [Pleurodeles waltl]
MKYAAHQGRARDVPKQSTAAINHPPTKSMKWDHAHTNKADLSESWHPQEPTLLLTQERLSGSLRNVSL